MLPPAFILCVNVQFGHYVIPFLDFSGLARSASIPVTQRYDYSDEAVVSLLVTALIFVAFGKRKNESTFIAKARQYAFYWSAAITWASTAVYFIAINFFELIDAPSRSLDFFFQVSNLFVVYNVLIPVIIFFPLFRYFRRKMQSEEQLKQFYLLPYSFLGIVGKCGTLLFMLLGIITGLFFTSNNNYADWMMLFPLAIALWVCAKEPHETKELFDTRLQAVQLSLFVQYILFILVYWLANGWNYADSFGFVVVSGQLIFLAIFYWMRYSTADKSGQKHRHKPTEPQPSK